MVIFSIVVPVFNCENYLLECLSSISNQTFDDFEIICIDDGSTDDSYRILDEYSRKENRMIIQRLKKNNGAANARNIGISLATGKYIQFVDADDIISMDLLEKEYCQFERNNLDICFIKIKHFDGTNVGIRGNYSNTYTGREFLCEMMDNSEFFLYLCSAVYSLSFLRSNRLTFDDLEIGEGGNYILNAVCQAEKIAVLDASYYYRINSSSVTNKKGSKCKTTFGQFVQYVNMLSRLCVDNQDNDGIFEFVEYQFRKVLGGIGLLDLDGKAYIETRLKTAFEKHLFNCFTNRGSIYEINIANDTVCKIKQGKKVIVYGAGYATIDVIKMLNQIDAEIIGIAVSTESEKKCLYGHRIRCIKEFIEYADNTIVVVSANIKYRLEIEARLVELGFNEYEFVDIHI